MNQNLYNKIFEMHVVRHIGERQYQLFVGLHLLHEVTSPQAFSMLEERGLPVAFPSLNLATADHAIPTDSLRRPFADNAAELMLETLERNVSRHDLRYFSPEAGENGIVHVLGPELGLSQPGKTLVVGDSHTATHGAFGALAFGIGTSQVRDVLATQTVVVDRLKVRRIVINGTLGAAVTAKDLILHIIGKLGPDGGVGYAYEFCGEAISRMTMDERMTVCNMAVEAGARVGYCNPDETTFAYLAGRQYSPVGEEWDRAVDWWRSLASDADATFDDEVILDAGEIAPLVTWGVNLGQSVPVNGEIPVPTDMAADEAASVEDALAFMGLSGGQPVQDIQIDVAFLGSCTNGRYSDFQAVAQVLQATGLRVAPGVRAVAVPGSSAVRREMVESGVADVLERAGFEVRTTGCSMCIAMNTDRLVGREMAASSSNRNFKGRQGSSIGRTLVMSPLLVAAAAVSGHVADPREVFSL